MPDTTVRAPGSATDHNDQTATPETSANPAAAPNEDQMVALAREAADYKDKLLRTLAEMENLRRRTEREVAEARLYGVSTKQLNQAVKRNRGRFPPDFCLR